MKHESRKVFVLENENYKELTYQEFCCHREWDISYKDKHFIPVQGMLLEVDKETYTKFYRNRERERYLKKQDIENGLLSIESFESGDNNGIDFIADLSKDIAEVVADKLLMDKLRECLSLLSLEEQKMISQHYYDEISEVELGRIYGISQQAVSKRLKKIREKVKEMMERKW